MQTKPILLPSLLALVLAGHGVAAQEVTSSLTGGQLQPEFNFIGFADLNYISADGDDPDGFSIGQAVAHTSVYLDDSLSAFAEFTATARDSEYAFEVERLIVKYDFSDLYQLSAGRFHTPVGYWNSAFHHGAWLQTTVSRPEAMKFGSQILPIHFVGVLLEGKLPTGDLGLEYKAGFGNGRHENIARAGDAGDINSDRAWMIELASKPRKIKDLHFGIGFYTDRLTIPASPDIEEKTFSAFAAWSNESPEVIIEYLHSEHELVSDSSVSGNVDAWYAQFAYRLPGNLTDWKPYARLERTRVDDSDPVLGAEGLDYDGGIIGVRWDFNPHAVLKAEYRNEEFDNAGRENNFRLQLALVLTKL